MVTRTWALPPSGRGAADTVRIYTDSICSRYARNPANLADRGQQDLHLLRQDRRGHQDHARAYVLELDHEVLPAAVVGPDITYERSIQHGPQAGTVNTWPANVVADHTLRAVCKDCNTGWMARSESAVAPLIEPMIKGQPAQLTVEQQLTVATWAAMKTAVFEYVWSEDPILTASDREIIRTQDRPPASVQVRLAAIEADGSPLRARGIGYEHRGSGEKIVCLTITMGCLVLQVFGGPGAGTRGLLTIGEPTVQPKSLDADVHRQPILL